MIVSQIWALLGYFKASHFRTEWPYVVPIHVTLYVIHMLQEHFDIYRRYPEGSSSDKDVKTLSAIAVSDSVVTVAVAGVANEAVVTKRNTAKKGKKVN